AHGATAPPGNDFEPDPVAIDQLLRFVRRQEHVFDGRPADLHEAEPVGVNRHLPGDLIARRALMFGCIGGRRSTRVLSVLRVLTAPLVLLLPLVLPIPLT